MLFLIIYSQGKLIKAFIKKLNYKEIKIFSATIKDVSVFTVYIIIVKYRHVAR